MIIWKSTETPELYVYTLRSRFVFIGSLVLIMGTLFYGINYYPHNQIYFYSWVVLLSVFVVDLFPMGFRQWAAKFKGKAIKKSGNLFIDTPIIEIQKNK